MRRMISSVPQRGRLLSLPPGRRIMSPLSALDTFVDVGANIGYFSLPAAESVDQVRTLIEFEPVPSVLRPLEAYLRLNGLDNIDTRGTAVSDSQGATGVFGRPTGKSAGSSAIAGKRFRPEEVADAFRLDDAGLDTSWIRVIEIEVEDDELRARAPVGGSTTPFAPIVHVPDVPFRRVAVLFRRTHSQSSSSAIADATAHERGDDNASQVLNR